MKNNLEIAVFGGGCFWCTEAIFSELKGIINVISGYAGGKMDKPSYFDVSSEKTGHAEVVKIEFDPEIISYDDLLEIFWNVHDPTSLNRQGNDTGTEYRSIILYTDKIQKKKALKSLEDLEKSEVLGKPVVTEIKALDKFYEAESYHKNYYQKNSNEPYCEFVISPKLRHLREKYGNRLKVKNSGNLYA